MARAAVTRDASPPQYRVGAQMPVGLDYKKITCFNQPKGMNAAARLFDVPLSMAPYMKNWRLDRGTSLQRPGLSKLGPAAATEILGQIEFTKSDGSKYIVRTTTTQHLIYGPGTDTWTAMTGPAFTYGASANVIYSGWGDQLMAVTLSGALHQLNVSAGTYIAITTTPRAVGSHITTFAGRAIMSQSDSFNRIAWSVKNDNTKWDPVTNIGAGFEDLFSTPGGNADSVLGVWPISDEQAIVVRSRSIWLMSVTGIVDAPFRFSRLYDKIACESPLAITNIPGGVMLLALDDIYVVTPTTIKAMAQNIRPRVISGLFEPSSANACYDEARGEWVLSVKEGVSTSFSPVVWRWSFFDSGWARDEYVTFMKYMTNARSLSGGITIDALTGTIDALAGTIDGLSGGGGAQSGILFVTKATSGASAGSCFSLREDPTKVQDWDSGYVMQSDVATEMWTGLISTGQDDNINWDNINQVMLDYVMASGTLDFFLEFSLDAGASWTTYSSGNTLPATTMPDVFRCAAMAGSSAIMFRLRTTKMNALRLNGIHFFVAQGAPQFP